MDQLDFFDETFRKKVYRMEKWIAKIQQQVNLFNEEMLFMHRVASVPKKGGRISKSHYNVEQGDMFGT